MKASRDADGNVVLTLTPDEAHVLIWGGPEEIFHGLEGMVRTALVGVEDAAMSDAEYRRRFDDLPALYERLRPQVTEHMQAIGRG